MRAAALWRGSVDVVRCGSCAEGGGCAAMAMWEESGTDEKARRELKKGGLT